MLRPCRVVVLALLLPALAQPLRGACSCTVTATVSGTTVNVSGTSTGSCSSLTEVRFASGSGTWGPPVQCFSSTSCTANTSWSTACLTTGEHQVRALCSCGQAGTNSGGSPTCSTSWSDAATTYAVYTTPSIGLAVSGPDASGRVQLSMPYSFPNTTVSASRDLYFNIDGITRITAYSDTVSGMWAPSRDMSCWDQGSHDLRAVAIACDKGDPSYRADAFGSVTIDHQPTVLLTLTPAAGGAQAQVSYSFPQTAYSSQRRLQIKAHPSGSTLASFQPTNREGTWTAFVSCSAGAQRNVVAVAAACDDTRVEAPGVIPECPKPPLEFGNPDLSCPLTSGPDKSVPVSGNGTGFGGKSMGPGAELFYQAGGAGNPANPGEAAWKAALGRNWSHDYAERLVPLSSNAVVWLITRHATFRKFDLYRSATGLYDRVSPTDETRKLKKTAAGWELRGLDGTVQVFNSTGLWQSTRDRYGNAKTASYTNGRLASVTMPDGRSETFGYHASGKLASITEVGVGGGAQRVWSYGWAGDDLVTIERPDGTGWRFVYGDPRHPGYMTRRLLVGADDGNPATPRPERVVGAWEYDHLGNVVRAWKGSDDFATGIERHEFAYDEPIEPKLTTVTIHRSATEQEVVTYALSRPVPWVGGKPRVEAITGSCSGCGLGPDTQMSYEDSRHPLRPTRIVDGRGVANEITYDANGQVISRLEAADTPQARETRWEYHPTFPELATRIEGPGPIGAVGGRQTRMTYDAVTGALLSSTVEGQESTYPGGTFSLMTTIQSNAAGQLLVIDPPGHGTADQTSYTYDPARGDLLPLSRIDPLVGSTTFAYDPFNRQVTTADPNGSTTVTAYDALNRVISVTQKGVTPAEDLVTHHFYDAFGDLACTQLPRGNGTEFIYDEAGRLIEIQRKQDCDPETQALERAVYVLNGWGQRVEERHEAWTGTAWETKSETGFVYANRCQLAKVIRPRSGSLAPAVTEYSYDCSGNLEKVWDANHPKTTNLPTQVYAYDALNRLSSVTQPWTGPEGPEVVTSYGYDLQDHLTSVTDAEGNVTTYAYSDRDLLTRQDSPVSGVTVHRYDDHGELVSETDARGITVERQVDVLGRVTLVDYPDDALDTAYTYDDPAGPFSKGRLTAITRPGSTISYAYDRFGRLLQDGALTYGYDANGNRVELGYPDGVVARYSFDFADRESSLEIQTENGPVQPLVTGATYLPSGPLAQLALGNGLVESRTYDPSYRPESIVIPGRLEQLYTTDAEGNILKIDRAVGQERFLSAFDYQDPQYFLTRGDGPWGQQSWTYDRIGNRLSDASSTYTYTPNALGSRTPKLSRIEPAPDGEPGSYLSYGFDAAGNQTSVVRSNEEGQGRVSSLEYSAESRLSRMSTSDGPAATELLYDGRGYLRRSRLTFSNSTDFEQTEPTYSLEGLLYSLAKQRQATRDRDGDDGASSTQVVTAQATNLFYFAGRPLAQWRRSRAGGSADELFYLTTDHLGTPILATDAVGGRAWEGGLDPFGEPYLFPCPRCPGDGDSEGGGGVSCTASISMEEAGVFLRFPGQWEDSSFGSAAAGGGVYYNVHRWYRARGGSYTQPDPLASSLSITPYAYADNRPTRYYDPLGLYSVDESCMCPQADPPWSPTYAHETPPGIEMKNLILGVDSWCAARWYHEITDPKLRECIEESCNAGRIACKHDCNTDEYVGFNRKVPRLINRTAWVCTNAPRWHETFVELGRTVIHEWAHGCGWRHGDGSGVPDDPGRGQ